MRPPKHNPTKPHCFLTQRTSNPEASRTNVSEETSQGVASVRRDKDIPVGQTLPNPDDAGPIVRHPIGLRQSLGLNPESLVAQLALRSSALDHCATLEA